MLTESHEIGVSTKVVRNKTIYATMQPPVPASMGADGAGSSSGVLEAMVKRSAKESIV